MMKQGDAVKQAILEVLTENGVNYRLNGDTPVSKYKELFKTKVIAMITQGFDEGKISLSAEAKARYCTVELLKTKYVPGLVDNWVRKTKEFNGGEKYTAKNPGSRSGSKDDSVIAMKNLLKTITNPEHRAEIESAIAERIAELKPESVIEIDVDALPEHLRHLV